MHRITLVYETREFDNTITVRTKQENIVVALGTMVALGM